MCKTSAETKIWTSPLKNNTETSVFFLCTHICKGSNNWVKNNLKTLNRFSDIHLGLISPKIDYVFKHKIAYKMLGNFFNLKKNPKIMFTHCWSIPTNKKSIFILFGMFSLWISLYANNTIYCNTDSNFGKNWFLHFSGWISQESFPVTLPSF
jgi:hypothetical protein